MTVLLKKQNKIYMLICICIFVLFAPGFAFAEEEAAEYNLTVKYPVEDVQISVYKIAEYTEDEALVLVESYQPYKEIVKGLQDLEENPGEFLADTWMELAKTLRHLSLKDGIACDYSMVTGKSGDAQISVERGLYLVLPKMKTTDNGVYTAVPVLTMLPYQNEAGQFQDTVTLDFGGKVSKEELKDTYSVEKIWKADDGKARPASIEVVLMQDYSHTYDTVVLNADNNWRYTWSNLPQGHHWAAYEKTIPSGYKVTYNDEGAVMYIKNTYTSTGEMTTGKKPSQTVLPDTGQLWWPVPVLAVLGLIFFAAGWIRYDHGERR
ncbi:MAG: Cna B-type domain-containing protein [Firmicutes bacterium]|nr:Cna B-type domain-containing protein [Bacillota bacterium]